MAFVFRRKLINIGNSVYCQVPKEAMENLGWKSKDIVKVSIENQEIRIRK